MTRFRVCITTIVALLIASAPALAASVPVPNFSFEGGNSVAPWDVSISGTQYDAYGASQAFAPSMYGNSNPSDPLPGSADGTFFAYVNLAGFEPSFGTFTSPSLGAALPSHVYTLTVAVGDRLDVDVNDVRIDILLDDVPVATTMTTGNNLLNGTFTDISASFVNTLSGDLKVRLGYSRTGLESNFESQVNFDNIRLTSVAVPEPISTTLLWSSGGVLLALRLRRAQKKSRQPSA